MHFLGKPTPLYSTADYPTQFKTNIVFFPNINSKYYSYKELIDTIAHKFQSVFLYPKEVIYLTKEVVLENDPDGREG